MYLIFVLKYINNNQWDGDSSFYFNFKLMYEYYKDVLGSDN